MIFDVSIIIISDMNLNKGISFSSSLSCLNGMYFDFSIVLDLRRTRRSSADNPFYITKILFIVKLMRLYVKKRCADVLLNVGWVCDRPRRGCVTVDFSQPFAR